MDNLTIQNPYPGLRPFSKEDAKFFYGRERHIGDLMDRLKKAHFISVVGESGCGKSSLVKAGLIPALAKGYMDELGVNWHTVEMRPGREPYTNLAYALLSNVTISDLFFSTVSATEINEKLDNELKKLENLLREGSKEIGKLLDIIDWPKDKQLLLLIDQFEELFTYYSENEDDAAFFIALILEASRHPNIFVITTMRLEYLKDYSQFTGLAEAINNGIYLTPKLTRKELTEAIVFPARKAKRGANVEDELANHLLNEIQGKQDSLPILQHALMRLWEQDEDKVLTYDEFKDLGSLDDYLNIHVSKVYKGLSPSEQKIARQIFTSLASKTKEGEYVRTEKSVNDLLKITVVKKDKLFHVIDEFIKKNRNFLSKIDKMDYKGKMIIDITHESLIRQWKIFKEWVDEEYEDKQNFLKLKEKIDDIEGESGRENQLESIEVKNALTILKSIERNNNYKLLQLDSFERIRNYIKKRENEIKKIEKRLILKEEERLQNEKEKLKQKEAALKKQRARIAMGVALSLSVAVFYVVYKSSGFKVTEGNIKVDQGNIKVDQKNIETNNINIANVQNKLFDVVKSDALDLDPTSRLNLIDNIFDTDRRENDENTSTAKLASSHISEQCIEDTSIEVSKRNADLYIELGLDYRYGRNDKSKNIQKAIACYKEAIKVNESPRARANLAAIYQYGFDTGIPDYKKAAEEYKKAADKGLNRAKYYLAWLYQKGLGVKQNYTKASLYYRNLKKYRSSKSQLSYLYYSGKGIKEDKTKAKEMLKEVLTSSNRSRDSLGLAYLGYFCAQEAINSKVNKNSTELSDCCKTEAKTICGLEYGKELLNEALNKPNYNYTAAYYLSKLEDKGTNDWKKYLKKASDRGIIEAQWEYYLFLKEQKKYSKALKLLQNLEPTEYKIVFLELGWFFYNCPKSTCSKTGSNRVKAFEYYLLAAQAYTKDPELHLSDEKKDNQKFVIERINEYVMGLPEYKTHNPMIVTLKVLAENGTGKNAIYQNMLGMFYEKGCKLDTICDLKVDSSKAKKMYEKAKKNSVVKDE